MAYVPLPTRVPYDTITSSDVNQLQENIDHTYTLINNACGELDVTQLAYSEYYVVSSLRTSPKHGELNYLTTTNKLFKYNAVTQTWVEIDWVNAVQATPEWQDGKLQIGTDGILEISPNGTNWQDCYPAIGHIIKPQDTTKLYYYTEINDNNKIYLHNCTYDYELREGQSGINIFNNTNTIPLNVKCNNGVYEIIIVPTSPNRGTSGGSTSAPTKLLINNTTYTNTISYAGQYILYDSTGGGLSYNNSQNGLILSHNLSPASIRAIVTTETSNKSCITHASAYGVASNIVRTQWGTSASNDTTTVWTSLGTITSPVSISGYIIVKRVL